MKKRIVVFFVLLALVFTTTGGDLFSAFAVRASAENESLENLDNTTVVQDLQSFDIDLSMYKKNPVGSVDLIYFAEIWYTTVSSADDANYNLYFWIYNPTGEPLNTSLGQLKVNLFGQNMDLVVLNNTDDFLFYKCKLVDSRNALTFARASALISEFGERSYSVSSIQIGKRDHKIAKTYIFSGFAKGCDETAKKESTLTLRYSGLDVISLDVKFACYRLKPPTSTNDADWRKVPFGVRSDGSKEIVSLEDDNKYYFSDGTLAGTLDNGVLEEQYFDWSKDAINTVYFGLPMELNKTYDSLVSLAAEWYEYKTAPIFVTSSNSAFAALEPYIGVNIGEGTKAKNDEPGRLKARVLYDYGFKIPASFNVFRYAYNGKFWNGEKFIDGFKDPMDTLSDIWSVVPEMNYLFEATDATKEGYKVSSNTLQEYMASFGDLYDQGGSRIFGYSSRLFASSIDADRTQLLENPNDKSGKVVQKVDLTNKLSIANWGNYSFWDKLFNRQPDLTRLSTLWIFSDTDIGLFEGFYNNYLADPTGGFWMGEMQDYYKMEDDSGSSASCFADIHNMIQAGLRPVLYRFALTDYTAIPAIFECTDMYTIDDKGKISIGSGAHTSGFNGYVAQETVFLNFDVMSLGFQTKDDGVNVKIIPVVADAIDVIPSLVAPDSVAVEEQDWWLKLVALLLLILLVAFVWPVITPFIVPFISTFFKIFARTIGTVINLCWQVLTFPFRLLGSLFRRR